MFKVPRNHIAISEYAIVWALEYCMITRHRVDTVVGYAYLSAYVSPDISMLILNLEYITVECLVLYMRQVHLVFPFMRCEIGIVRIGHVCQVATTRLLRPVLYSVNHKSIFHLYLSVVPKGLGVSEDSHHPHRKKSFPSTNLKKLFRSGLT